MVCPGSICRRAPLPETTCQAELDKLVSPRTDGSLGLRVTSATGPPGDWAMRPGTWCSSRRSPGTMTRNFAPTRKRLPLLPAGAAARCQRSPGGGNARCYRSVGNWRSAGAAGT